MKVGYIARTAFAVGWLAVLGQQTVSSSTPLEKRLQITNQAETAEESSQTLFSKLLAEIRGLKEEHKNSPETYFGLYRSFGFLVYDDLNKLANRFGIKLGLDELIVYTMGEHTKTDEIVVESIETKSADLYSLYSYTTSSRVVFYSDKQALVEDFDSITFKRRFRRLRITEENDRQSVEEEDSSLYKRDFAYVIDMQKYDFQKVYRRLAELLTQKKRFDIGDPKYDHIDWQIGMISNGLFNMYGGVPSSFLVHWEHIIAGNGVISIFATPYSPSIADCFLWLKIENKEEAHLFVQRQANAVYGIPWKIQDFKVRPGDNISRIVSEIVIPGIPK